MALSHSLLPPSKIKKGEGSRKISVYHCKSGKDTKSQRSCTFSLRLVRMPQARMSETAHEMRGNSHVIAYLRKRTIVRPIEKFAFAGQVNEQAHLAQIYCAKERMFIASSLPNGCRSFRHLLRGGWFLVPSVFGSRFPPGLAKRHGRQQLQSAIACQSDGGWFEWRHPLVPPSWIGPAEQQSASQTS